VQREIVCGNHTEDEILSLLKEVGEVAVATSAGDRLRTRMMHYAPDDDFNIYLATMKNDPKTLQITQQPSISLLVLRRPGDIGDSCEVEITGRATLVRDDAEQQKALDLTAGPSPIVAYLKQTGGTAVLDYIRVVPETIKLRIFKEIVQGTPPTVLEFAQNKQQVSDWDLLKRKARSWVAASRDVSLTASVVPALLGTAVAWFATGTLSWGLFLLTLIASVAIQAGTNIFNDYFDHLSGNDEGNREFVRPFSGGSRVIQLGLLSPLEMLTGGLLLILLSVGIGIYLSWVSGPFLLVLGVIGVMSGVFYTGKPFNWASRGFGELLVGLNYGVLMTLGAYYVQTGAFSWQPVIAALPVAALISAVLYINEFPDYKADLASKKKTLVVRLGRQKAVLGFALLTLAAHVAVVVGILVAALPLATVLALLSLPLSVRAIQHAYKNYDSSFDLIPANALTVTSHLATGLLLTLAYAWEVLGLNGAAYVAVLGVAFAGAIIYMYSYVERQKNIFLGVKQVLK